MTEINKPSWIKRMENGTIGEATAREFLIDRFWILERSVDIHGADLIIQRRLSSQNILDKNPPKFGVIQVKFFQDEDTTQYIPKEYILDDDGSERKEFFVLAISGYEDSKKIFILSSKDILSNFELIKEESKTHYNSYRLTGKKIIEEKKFIVSHKKTALDKIENTLNLSSFNKNRLFISYILPEINTEIDTPYIINVANDRADFKKWQNEIKENIKKTIYALEDTIEKLKESLQETDPLKIEEIIEDIGYTNRQGDLVYTLSIDNNFFEEARYYKAKHDNLETKGLLQNFIKTQEKLTIYIANDKINDTEVGNDEVYLITITYDNFLERVNIKSSISSVSQLFHFTTERVYSGFINETINSFTYYYVPNNHSYYDNSEKVFGTYKPKKWKEVLLKISEVASVNDIMNKVYDNLTK
ncbi:hypothetical protein [Spirosoma pollinicola]|uniref:DUF4365 domain-containing protein n=1 Tax=Spirosoma pollinicola TaxID=2057025 RepID=A0A2K8Z2D7_9BACT|nr:hypothetical protein [Spirosoma pollinicola]AUD04011.1 hypothetical protein CWM47_20585 [Spirosoma pollinicola]